MLQSLAIICAVDHADMLQHVWALGKPITDHCARRVVEMGAAIGALDGALADPAAAQGVLAWPGLVELAAAAVLLDAGDALRQFASGCAAEHDGANHTEGTTKND